MKPASCIFTTFVSLALLPLCPAAAGENAAFTVDQVKAYFQVKNAEARRDGVRVEYRFDEFRLAAKGPPYTLEDLESYQPAPILEPRGKADNSANIGVRIRRDHNDVLPEEDQTASDPKDKREDLDGALLSWGHDFMGSADSWDVRGALLLPLTWTTNRHDAVLSEWGVVPSISLHKSTSESLGAEDTDSLVVRMGGWAGLTPGGAAYYHRVSGWASLATDSEGNGKVWAGECEWEPRLHLGKHFGLGSYHSLLTRENPKGPETILGYTLSAALHGEAGQIDNPGETALQAGSFVRVGPRVKLTVDPLFNKTLTASVEYTKLFDFEGDSPEPDYLRAALIWSPNEGKNWAVRVEYENGGLDLTQERVDQITAGLQIRF